MKKKKTQSSLVLNFLKISICNRVCVVATKLFARSSSTVQQNVRSQGSSGMHRYHRNGKQ